MLCSLIFFNVWKVCSNWICRILQIFFLETWYLQHCLLHLTMTHFLESCLYNAIRCGRLHFYLRLKIFGISYMLDFSSALAIIVLSLISKQYDLKKLLKIMLLAECWERNVELLCLLKCVLQVSICLEKLVAILVAMVLLSSFEILWEWILEGMSL